MAQNANQDDKSIGSDETIKAAEEELNKLKDADEEVDGSDEDNQDETSEDDKDDKDSEDAGDDDGKTDDDSADDDSEDADKTASNDDDSEFVKEFPNIKGETLVDYARNLESTISKSNTEGKRLADENAELKRRLAVAEAGGATGDGAGDGDSGEQELTPEQLYIRQKQTEEIDAAFADLRRTYPQVEEPTEYDKFVEEVKVLGQAIYQSQKRLAPPKELYAKAAAILGWEPNKVDSSDRLKVALKDRAAISKTTSSTKKAPKSKVTDAMVRFNRKLYPNKTDDQIRKELEPYVQ